MGLSLVLTDIEIMVMVNGVFERLHHYNTGRSKTLYTQHVVMSLL